MHGFSVVPGTDLRPDTTDLRSEGGRCTISLVGRRWILHQPEVGVVPIQVGAAPTSGRCGTDLRSIPYQPEVGVVPTWAGGSTDLGMGIGTNLSRSRHRPEAGVGADLGRDRHRLQIKKHPGYMRHGRSPASAQLNASC